MNRAPGLSTGPLTGDLLARARRVIPGGTLEDLTLPPEVQVVPARGRGYIRGYLSLAHTKQDLVDTAEALRGAMRAVAAAG